MCEAHDRDGGGDFHGVGDGDVEEEEYCGGDVHDVGVGCIDEDDGEDGRRVVREAHVCRGLLNFWPPRQLVERASTIPHIVVLLVVALAPARWRALFHTSVCSCSCKRKQGSHTPDTVQALNYSKLSCSVATSPTCLSCTSAHTAETKSARWRCCCC